MEPNTPLQDSLDLIIIVAWAYAGGYTFAWLISDVGWHPFRVGSIFGLIGLVTGLWGIERRRSTGRFPILASLLIFALPFNCALLGIVWRILSWIE